MGRVAGERSVCFSGVGSLRAAPRGGGPVVALLLSQVRRTTPAGEVEAVPRKRGSWTCSRESGPDPARLFVVVDRGETESGNGQTQAATLQGEPIEHATPSWSQGRRYLGAP